MFETISEILTETFKVPADRVTLDASFDSMQLDSLDIVELTLVIEEQTGLKIGDDEVEKIWTVGDAVALLAEKQGAPA